jgi:hypothetical protein
MIRRCHPGRVSTVTAELRSRHGADRRSTQADLQAVRPGRPDPLPQVPEVRPPLPREQDARRRALTRGNPRWVGQRPGTDMHFNAIHARQVGADCSDPGEPRSPPRTRRDAHVVDAITVSVEEDHPLHAKVPARVEHCEPEVPPHTRLMRLMSGNAPVVHVNPFRWPIRFRMADPEPHAPDAIPRDVQLDGAVLVTVAHEPAPEPRSPTVRGARRGGARLARAVQGQVMPAQVVPALHRQRPRVMSKSPLGDGHLLSV